MLPFIIDAPSAVQFTMLLLCGIMGLSHLLRPEICDADGRWTAHYIRLRFSATSA